MHLNTDGAMCVDDIQDTMSKWNEDYLNDVDKMQDRFKELQRTRTLALWHDHATLLGTSFLTGDTRKTCEVIITATISDKMTFADHRILILNFYIHLKQQHVNERILNLLETAHQLKSVLNSGSFSAHGFTMNFVKVCSHVCTSV